ncbi:TrmH family RNA methyltransferase [Carboxylicivirga caseinilyticus]|uniref:TrmH family RNA methyltransferase n=1 Tax=Carboxylicivirga caseinilyticus TaxID=3417572 RepID=UPI003D34DE34|nr:TrmH family RNA methyltransferase [Marinilabiliaceae bacterium A049]
METHSKYFFSDHHVPGLPENMKPILIADSFATPSNIGSLIRLGANLGISKVIVLNGFHLRQSKIKKTAGAALQHIEVVYTETPQLLSYIPSEYSIVGIETAENATSIFDQLPKKVAFVLGNEKYGISKEVLEICHSTRYIPMPGKIKSMNVSHAASVSLFEWYRQINN